MTNSKQSTSEDAFERLASGRSARVARPEASTRRRESIGHAAEAARTPPAQSVSRSSLPSWSHTTPPSRTPPTQRSSLLQAALAAQLPTDSPTPHHPCRPTGEASKLSQRRLEVLEAQNERLQQQIQQLRHEQEVCNSTQLATSALQQTWMLVYNTDLVSSSGT
jgi:hypothetical protein